LACRLAVEANQSVQGFAAFEKEFRDFLGRNKTSVGKYLFVDCGVTEKFTKQIDVSAALPL